MFYVYVYQPHQQIRDEYPAQLHEEPDQPTQYDDQQIYQKNQPTSPKSKKCLAVPDDSNQRHYVNFSSLRRTKSMASIAYNSECSDQTTVHNRPWSPSLYQYNEDSDDATTVGSPAYQPSHVPPVLYRQQGRQEYEILDSRNSNKVARNSDYMRDKRFSVQFECESSSNCIYCHRQFSDIFKYLRHEKSCPQRPGV